MNKPAAIKAIGIVTIIYTIIGGLALIVYRGYGLLLLTAIVVLLVLGLTSAIGMTIYESLDDKDKDKYGPTMGNN